MEILKYITKDVLQGFKQVSEKLLTELDIDKKIFPLDIYKVAEKWGMAIDCSNNLNVHAKLSDGKIILNANDEDAQKRFSVAHEIAHILVKDFLSVELVDDKKGLQISYSYKNRELKNVAREFGKTKLIDKQKEKSMFLQDLYEEVVDYCAAQLLIPCGIFSLEIGCSDEILAERFGVKPSCIRKRRSELPYELNVFAPSNFSESVIYDAATEEDIESILGSW